MASPRFGKPSSRDPVRVSLLLSASSASTPTNYLTDTLSHRLVATLGPKSNLRRVNRKAILNVDVKKACETIMQPEAPLALRLQSNLLYGVTKVYSQQCNYVLADCQTAQNHIRALSTLVKGSELDPKAGKSR